MVNRITPSFLFPALLALFTAIVPLSAEEAARPAQPNVIILLVDDLGWQDVKCYDLDEPSPMETPHIDALAQEGVLFRQAYSPGPVCAPSRAGILTGVHPARAKFVGVAGGNPPHPLNQKGSRMITPWDRGSIDPSLLTVATALKKEGYSTGHCGKWHLSKNDKSPTQPTDVGFDWSRENHGVVDKMLPHRMTGFATREDNDPYQLDDQGFPKDQNNLDALTFLREQKEKPFFLYYATYLVHAPIHMRSRELLDKYAQKLGVDLPKGAEGWDKEGQSNPLYCAMVEQLDYYLGQLFTYLHETDDPRWPGHKLHENTYLIFTSDNGGMEGDPSELITDNAPLDEGKIHLQEGGIRVPLLITGPGIKAGVESHVMVNGLDFYPTILSLVGAEKPSDLTLDGSDLSSLLLQDPTDPSLVKDSSGQVRDTLMWHFPNSVWMESAIRIGDYKLMRNYDHQGGLNSRWTRKKAPPLELYRLYNTENGTPVRVDIEEQKNLVEEMPEKAQELNARLTELLTQMDATYPSYNPHCIIKRPHQENIPTVKEHHQKGRQVTFTYQEHGATVTQANLLYTTDGAHPRADWISIPADLLPEQKVQASLPPKATHYFLNLIDENNFLISYPDLPAMTTGKKHPKGKKTRPSATDTALEVKK